MAPDAQRDRGRRVARGRRLARTALVAALAATLGSATLAGAAGRSSPTARGQVLATPMDREVPANGDAEGVACPAGGGCVAVGSYLETNRDVNALTWFRSSGRWHAAFRITSPIGVPSTDPSTLDDVACSKAGLCVAVGTADVGVSAGRGTGSAAPIAERIVGRVSRAVVVPLPAGARELVYAEGHASSDVGTRAWCEPEDGRCVIVGSLIGPTGLLQGFAAQVALDHRGPGWVSTASALPLPEVHVGRGFDERVNGLSCTDVGDCVVVGLLTRNLADAENDDVTTRAFVQDETHGVWSRPMVTSLPKSVESKDPLSELDAVACAPLAASGPPSCVAVGSYELATYGVRPLVLRYADARWALGDEPSLSRLPARSGLYAVVLGSVSCTGVDACVAGGEVTTSQAPPNGHDYAIDAQGTTLGFDPAAALTGVPAIGGAPAGSSFVTGVACPVRQATCTAVGVEQGGDDVEPFSVLLALTR